MPAQLPPLRQSVYNPPGETVKNGVHIQCRRSASDLLPKKVFCTFADVLKGPGEPEGILEAAHADCHCPQPWALQHGPMRYINDIIVHCAATPPGMDVDCSVMRAWDKQRGLRTIAYHYLVRLDGTVENGRAASQPGAHCKMHNAHSVGVCYVGGLNDAGTICDTRTDDQKAALLKLLTTLTRMYRCRIHGHRDYEATLCPGFDASAEYGNIYRQIVIEGR